MRLITHVVNLSDDFYDGFTRSWHLYKFQTEGEEAKLTPPATLDIKLRNTGCKTIRGLLD